MRLSAFAPTAALALAIARAAAADDTVIPWTDTEKHVGETVTVEGRVLGAHCSPTSCLLAFDPTFNRFTVVVQAKDFKALPPDTLNASYVGRAVRVHGRIQMLERKPEIVVAQAADLQLAVTPEEKAQKREATEAALADRMDELIDRLDDLAGRMDQTQQQLGQLATAIAQQSEQLAAIAAAANAPPPPPPPEPSYGEPQPRPGYEALRSIKRGMTSADVARLVGQPNVMQSNSAGGYIWDYGYGRTVTFDQRSRVVGSSGFPAP